IRTLEESFKNQLQSAREPAEFRQTYNGNLREEKRFMARSDIHPGEITASHSHELANPAAGERKLRRVSAWLMLFFLIQGELGAVWDREWHAYVGRDQFWTPPHTLSIPVSQVRG